MLLSGVRRQSVAPQANAAADDEPEEDEVTAAFRRAAEAVKEKREEEAMSVEERIYKCAARPAARPDAALTLWCRAAPLFCEPAADAAPSNEKRDADRTSWHARG